MSKFEIIKKQLSNYESLERALSLKQLQISRLLNITQAINDNLSASGLYNMYNSFLSWEMGVKKMALFVFSSQNDKWECTSSIGLSSELLSIDIEEKLSNYTRLNNLSDNDHPLIGEFDIVIPVLHKEKPIAYAFIGGFDDNDNMYDKVQFITTITNIIAVAIENKRLFKQQIAQEKMQQEMRLATEMQLMLIPDKLPKNELYASDSIYLPMLGVGGDYFDFIDYDDSRFAFCIADISGKGISAALLMANFQAALRLLINKRIQAKPFIKELNKSVYEATKGDRFITFFIGEYNTDTRELIYVNAGHNPPPLIMNGEITLLDKGCTILGSFPDIPNLEVGKMHLPHEALIVTYTDGLTDLKDTKGNFFSEDILYEFCRLNAHLQPSDFNKTLLHKMEDFKGSQGTFPDDTTILTIKIF